LFHVFAGGQRICTFERDSILNGGSGTSTNYVGYFYHQDHLGSSSVLSDYAGSLKELNVFYPFGRTQTNNPAAPFKVSNRFTGQIQDEETGLYYYNARYYDPELGRFIQPDTIIPDLSNPQTFNRYSYVYNNPLKFTDPTGHEGYWAGVGNVFAGYWDFARETASGTWQMVRHPIDTGKGIWHAGTHPIDTAQGVWNGVKQTASDVTSGDNRKAGKAFAEIVSNVIPAAKAKQVGNLGKLEKLIPDKLPIGPCFPAGTLVATPTGEVPIEDLAEGDEVYAYDFETQSVVVEKVLQTPGNWTDIWIDVATESETIRATRRHRFWVESEQAWMEAQALKTGMVLLLQSGETRSITQVSRYDAPTPEDTFNLEVSRVHNYFVGTNGFLVHNGDETKNLPGRSISTPNATSQTLQGRPTGDAAGLLTRNVGYPTSPQYPPPTQVGETFQFNFDTSPGYRNSRAAGKARALNEGYIKPGEIGDHINTVQSHPHLITEPSNYEGRKDFKDHFENGHNRNFQTPKSGPLRPKPKC
jgi:RHS repeat-associated protein